MKKSMLIGSMMLVFILVFSSIAMGVTVTKNEAFTGYSAAMPKTGTSSNLTWYSIYNKNLAYVTETTRGRGDSKSLDIGSGTKGQNFTTTMTFNYTNYAFSKVGFYVNGTNTGVVNKMIVYLNNIGNSVTFNSSGNFTDYFVYTNGVRVAGPLRCGHAKSPKCWFAVNFTLNWTTHRVNISVQNATSGALMGHKWVPFTSAAGWTWPGTWSYKKITGLTFTGYVNVGCKYYVDDVHASFTYTPTWRVSNPWPPNGCAFIRKPFSYVTVTRTNAVNENVTIYLKNNTGVFNYANYTHAYCGSSIQPSFKHMNATAYSHTYYWKVVIESYGVYYNTTYRFTTWSHNLIDFLGFPDT